jgi:hypothetical protein
MAGWETYNSSAALEKLISWATVRKYRICVRVIPAHLGFLLSSFHIIHEKERNDKLYRENFGKLTFFCGLL